MRDDSLQARYYRQLDAAPERRAVAFYGRHGDFQWASRGEVHARAERAAELLSEAGLGRGDTSVIVLAAGAAPTCFLLGSLLVGARPVMLAPPSLRAVTADLERVLAHVLRKTRARVVVHDGLLGDGGKLSRRRGRVFLTADLDALAEPPKSERRPTLPAANDIAALQLTSGTTGLPRVCVWQQRGVLAALDAMARAMRLEPATDVCFNWTPLYHDMGLVNNLFLSIASGVPIVLQSPTEFVQKPARWLRGLSATGATITWSPNFGYALAVERIADSELDGVRLDHVRQWWNAAERIHLGTLEAFHRRFAPWGVARAALKTNFGCAENVGGATFSDPDGTIVIEHVDRAALFGERVARPLAAGTPGTEPIVSAGRASPGLELHVLSGAGRHLDDGRVGELALATPSRMLGYLGNQAATRRALAGDLLRTGDLAYLRSGELFWVGRVRERINLRGKKLDPSDFERVLVDVPGLRKGCFAAFGAEDRDRGTSRLVIVAEVRRPVPADLGKLEMAIKRRVFAALDVTVDEVALVESGTLAKTSSGKRRHRHFAHLWRDGVLQRHRLDRDHDRDPDRGGSPAEP